MDASVIFKGDNVSLNSFVLNNKMVKEKSDFYKTKDIQIDITSSSQHKKRMSLSFTLQKDFIVRTYPFDWEVSRSLNDFVILQ